jgi:hypothetical protein
VLAVLRLPVVVQGPAVQVPWRFDIGSSLADILLTSLAQCAGHHLDNEKQRTRKNAPQRRRVVMVLVVRLFIWILLQFFCLRGETPLLVRSAEPCRGLSKFSILSIFVVRMESW